MEIKAELQKPYEEQQRIDFIITQNHNLGYEIRETETALQACGYTEEEIAQQEREGIAQLSLTKREVFLAIYRDKQITPEQIRAMLATDEARIEFDYANGYFRGNPLIGQLGEALGYTSKEMDYLFINKELPDDRMG